MTNPTVNPLTISLSAPEIILSGTGEPLTYVDVYVYTGEFQGNPAFYVNESVFVDAYGNWELDLSGNTIFLYREFIAATYNVLVGAEGAPLDFTAVHQISLTPEVLALTFTLASDSGLSDSDRLTNDGTFIIGNLLDGATWEYQLNGGAWQAGTGNSFVLPSDGTYDVKVRQIDANGFVGPQSSGATDGALNLPGNTLLITANPILASTDFTYAMTVNFDTLNGDFVLFGSGDLATSDQSMIRITNGQISIHTANVGDEIVVPIQLQAGVDYTFVATYNSLYVSDGTTATQLWSDGEFDQDFGQHLQFGAWSNGSFAERSIRGTISNVQVYTRALTGEDLATVLEGGVANATAEDASYLAVHYTFQDPDALGDRSGNENDLVVHLGGPSVVGDGRSLTYVLDTVAPAKPVPGLINDSGRLSWDGVTNDGRVAVGGLEADTTWEWSLDSGVTWQAGSGTGFTLPKEGQYFILVRQTDAAGNVGLSEPTFVDFDISRPATPSLQLSLGQGTNDSGNLTDSSTITVLGLEQDASWIYSIDGQTWQIGVGGTIELPAEGVYSVRVRQTDRAGNASDLITRTVIYDGTPPVAPTVSLDVDSGASGTDGITGRGASVVVGGLEPGGSWDYSMDGGVSWKIGDGSSFRLADVDGAYVVVVRQTDVAGRVATSNPVQFVVDTTPPPAPTFVFEGDASTDPGARIIQILGLENGASWQYSIDGGSWKTGAGTSFRLPADVRSSMVISLRQTDLAGNTGPSAEYLFDLPQIVIGTGDGEFLMGLEGDDFISGLDGGDVLEGYGGSDILDGGQGNDLLSGGQGADILVGGEGVDIASYASSGAGVVVRLDTGRGTGGDAQGDILVGIENLYGSVWNDRLFGNAQSNTIVASSGSDQLTGLAGDDVLEGGAGWDSLFGGAGDDTLDGGVGADVLNGGQGIDTATYRNSAQGVVILMEEGSLTGGDARGDRLIGIENVIGSGFADTISGTTIGNVLSGFEGDDLLMGMNGNDTLAGGDGNDALQGGNGKDLLEGGAGADTLDGGIGVDMASWAGSSAGVSVNLRAKTAEGGDATGDVLIAIENLTGSDNADTLVGNLTANMLIGGKGNDALSGLGGNDTLQGDDGNDRLDGGTGNDILTGGSGADQFVFLRGCGDDRITDFGAGDTLSLDRGLWAQTGATTLESFLATHARQEGGQVVLTFSASDILRLDNMMLSDLLLHSDQYFV